jgi:restriction system protein
MSVPDFQSFFLPLLELAADDVEHTIGEAREYIAKIMMLPEADRRELLPSGTQTKFDNRVAWAKSYFIQARVLESTRRGYFKITGRGKELLALGLKRIDIKILNRYPEFMEFHSPKHAIPAETERAEKEQPSETPEETLQRAYQNIKNDLAAELLERIRKNTPTFFETLVVDLMLALGYGGSRIDAGQSVGQSGDEGIDGIIKEDRLGLDQVYLQAKRWEGTVGRPEIQKFVGALHGKRARKGVFITTGKFSDDAFRYVESIDPKVVLIDGRRLADLMIDNNVGVTETATYSIKRVDSDFFSEE